MIVNINCESGDVKTRSFAAMAEGKREPEVGLSEEQAKCLCDWLVREVYGIKIDKVEST